MVKDVFIIRLNPVCWLTLVGLGIDLAACMILIDLPHLEAGSSFAAAGGGATRFFFAMGLMYLGMLTDAFDGILARKFGWDGEFGRYLDGFVDVFNYLILPNLALWRLGFTGPVAAVVMTAMIATGILRLSKFNQIGNIKVEGASGYLGLPVFWSQLLLFPLYLAFAFAGNTLHGQAFAISAGVVWSAMAFAFIYNRSFFKPKNTWVIAGVTLSLSGAGFACWAMGLHP